MNLRFSVLLLLSPYLLLAVAHADVTLPSVLADHMVIQREVPVHVWGMAAEHEKVMVTFRGETQSTVADDLGRWSLYLLPGEAGGPFQLTVKAANMITLQDVLVGDVWVASGQSNMEFPMTELTNASTEIAAAQYPKIRIFMVEHRPADFPRADVDARTWVACTPESVAKSSAVAYYFARELHQRLNIPFGLIESFWGGTPAESWTSLGALSTDASLMPVFARRNDMVAEEEVTRLQRKHEEREYQKAVAAAKAAGKPEPGRSWHPDFAAWAPAALYNGMIAPLTHFSIRGVIWYQGEANSGPPATLYGRQLETLIRDWRHAWNVGDFPFLIVQLANWNTDPEGLWPEVREGQRKALALKNTAMAVTIDIGDAVDIHPKDKRDVGLRLALGARAVAYGEKIEWSGPLYRQLTREEHGLRVWFDHANGLGAKGGPLVGFEIAGADGKFVAADATIDGATVVVSNALVKDPVSVRYAWAANPTCNLYNREGLPASPFRAPE